MSGAVNRLHEGITETVYIVPLYYGTPKWSKIGQRIVAYRGVYLNVAACI